MKNYVVHCSARDSVLGFQAVSPEEACKKYLKSIHAGKGRYDLRVSGPGIKGYLKLSIHWSNPYPRF